MTTITFNVNWNNKLKNTAFTTFRRFNPSIYAIGNQYEIIFRKEKGDPGELIGTAEIISLKKIDLAKITDEALWLDFGRHPEWARGQLSHWYGTDPQTPIHWLFLRYL